MTTRSKDAWPREQALAVAEELRELLGPACGRLEIAGSLRRGRDTVGDVELLAIPKMSDGDAPYSLLDPELADFLDRGVLDYRLDSRGRKTFGKFNKFLVHRHSGVPVDLFITGEENWGMALLVRTGPKEWNVRVMSRFMALGMRGHAYGGVTRGKQEYPCPEEADVFKLLRWAFVPPEKRVP